MDLVFLKFIELNTFSLWGSVQVGSTTIYMTYMQFCEIFQPICSGYRRGVRFSYGRIEPYMSNPKNEDIIEQIPFSWRGLTVEFKSNVADHTLQNFGDAHISVDALLKPLPDYVMISNSLYPSILPTLYHALLPGQSVETEMHDTCRKLEVLITSNEVYKANCERLTMRLKTVNMVRELWDDSSSYFRCLPRDLLTYIIAPYMLQKVKY